MMKPGTKYDSVSFNKMYLSWLYINPMIIDQDNHIIYPSDSRVMTFGNSFIIQYNYVPFVRRRLIY